MNEIDDNGWFHIHHAAARGFIKAVKKFVDADARHLEIETRDGLSSTPLLVAVMSGNIETLKILVDLGADTNASNTHNHSAIEIAAAKDYIEILEYFLTLDQSKCNVWKRLIAFLSSSEDEEIEAAAKSCLSLTQPDENGNITNNWPDFVKNQGVNVTLSVLQSESSSLGKLYCLKVLINICQVPQVQSHIAALGGIALLIKLLYYDDNLSVLLIVQAAGTVLGEMVKNPKYSEDSVRENLLVGVLHVFQRIDDPNTLEIIVALLNECVISVMSHQILVLHTPRLVSELMNNFQQCTHEDLLLGSFIIYLLSSKYEPSSRERKCVIFYST